MNDEEIRKLTERADMELRALDRRMAKLRESKFKRIFTKDEKNAWSQTEPNFPKRIIKLMAVGRASIVRSDQKVDHAGLQWLSDPNSSAIRFIESPAASNMSGNVKNPCINPG